MIKVFNNIFNTMKIVLLLVSFIMILYIMLYTFHYTGKNAFGREFFEFFGTLLPFILVLMVFIVNYILKIDNVFFNTASIIALLSIVIIEARTLFDQNMIFWAKDGYNINFHYFANQVVQIKSLVYFIFITNILLIIEKKFKLKKEIKVLE